ncbi:MAG TPA: Mut7-C RNAse domain-containing protein [Burkholderiales bacterium]
MIASFRFHGELADFLPRERRGARFDYACARAATLKNAIEALGVPHTEVGRLAVNGEPATLQRVVREGDAIEVFARQPEKVREPLFLADAHLGGLARFLRMLGYDTLHDPRIDDREIRRRAHDERRIVLTRDRELLKCREIMRGAYVHAIRVEAQLAEVAARFRLAEDARPFTLCLRCNLPLEPVEKAAVAERLPGRVRELQEAFTRCPGCERIYWPGSHWARMRSVLTGLCPPVDARAPENF